MADITYEGVHAFIRQEDYRTVRAPLRNNPYAEPVEREKAMPTVLGNRVFQTVVGLLLTALLGAVSFSAYLVLSDMGEIRKDMRTDVSEIRSELSANKADIQKEIGDTQRELSKDVSELRDEITRRIDTLIQQGLKKGG